MTYHQAKARIAQKRLIGGALIVIGAVVTIIGLLNYMYVRLHEGGALFAGLALALKRLIYAIYEKTQFLSFVWSTPHLQTLKTFFPSATSGSSSGIFASSLARRSFAQRTN